MSYVELHARSAFSFLEGASVPEELIAAGLELEMPAMALLDRDGVYGAPRFHLSANPLHDLLWRQRLAKHLHRSPPPRLADNIPRRA